MPTPSPTAAASDFPTLTIKSNGAELPGTLQIAAVTIQHALNRLPWAQIVVLQTSPATDGFTAASTPGLADGARIEILAGYGATSTPLFSGLLVTAAVQQSAQGAATFTIGCRGFAYPMTLGRRSAEHAPGATDQTVMQSLIGRHGLTASVADSPATAASPAVQFAATDWDLLLTCAEANGFVVNATGSTIAVGAPQFDATPVLAVTLGVDLLAYELEHDVRTQLTAATCAA